MGLTISPRSLRLAGIALLLLYIVAGGVYSFVLPAETRFSDEREYLLLSGHLVHGPGFSMDGVHLTAARAPGYPFFLAAIEAVGGGIGVMRVAQFGLIGATILLLARLCASASSSATLPFLIGLIALYPVLFYTGATLYPQTLAGFLFVLALTQLLAAPTSWVKHMATGLTFGALVLTVPTFAFTLIVVLATARALRLIGWRDGLLIFLGASLLIGTWTARNAIQFHQFVPIASNSGANLLIGNCENTIPTGGSGNVDRTHYQEEARARGLDEFQEDRYYRDAAVAWVAHHPGQAAVLYLEKAANFFNVINAYAPESQAEVSVAKQAVMAATYGLLLALLAWRLLDLRRDPPTPREKLLLIVYVLSAFTGAIFFTRIRLRLPYDYLIIAVIAMHLARRLDPWLDLTEPVERPPQPRIEP